MSPLVRKPEEKYKLPTKYWLLILSAISVILMLVTFVFDIPLKPLNEVVSVTVVPLQKGISIVGENLYSKKELFKQVNELVDQNNKLMEQVNELTIQNNKLLQDTIELNSLLKLYELDQTYSDYPKTGARVISGSTGNWFSTFIIDKGSNDGLQVGKACIFRRKTRIYWLANAFHTPAGLKHCAERAVVCSVGRADGYRKTDGVFFLFPDIHKRRFI